MNEQQTTPTTQDSGKRLVRASEIIAKYQNSNLQDVIEELPSVIAAEITLLASKIHEAGSICIKAEQAYHNAWVNIRTECNKPNNGII